MNKEHNYIEQLKAIDRQLLTIIGLTFFLSIFAIISQSKLDIRNLQNRYDNLIEFYENHKIFEKYFRQYKDLYWELNKKASESTDNKDNLQKYDTFAPLFALRHPRSWDAILLDNLYPYQIILEEAFVEDWNYWTTKGKERLKNRWPEISDIDVDIEKRLLLYIHDKDYLRDFFPRNFETRISFLKEILQKYEITVEDTIFESLSIPLGGDFKSSFISFLNDTSRITFYMISPYHFLWGDLPFGKDIYKLNDFYNSICIKIYRKYVRDKFLVYDRKIFYDKLPYASYLDKIERTKIALEKKFQNNFQTIENLKPPFSPLEIDILTFYQALFWILFVFSIAMRNFLIYKDSLCRKYNLDEPNCVSPQIDLVPSFLNIMVLTFKNKRRAIKFILSVFQFILPLFILFGINLKYFNILYVSIIRFLFLAIIPIILSTILFFFKFTLKQGLKRVL